MKICVYGAASSEIDQSFITSGEELGKEIAKRGHSLVFGAGEGGMMGATARGAYEEKGEIIGITPSFFQETDAEIVFDKCNNLIITETMRERKQLLENSSDAFVMVPGGIGTFDEFFEILTLKQLGRHNKAIVVYNINGYYNNLLDMMQHSIDKRFITENCVELFKVTTTAKETVDYIENYDPTDVDINLVKIR